MKTTKQVADEIIAYLGLDVPKKIVIVADNDEDGITSATNVRLFLKKNGHEVLPVFFDRHLVKEEFVFLVKEFAPDKTIFLDLGVDFVEEILEDIGEFTNEFVSIDHHKSQIVYQKAKFDYLFIHPSDFSQVDSSKYPVSKMVFDLFGGKDWVSALGVIGDSSSGQWQEFMDSVQKKYSLSFDQLYELTQTIVAIRTQYRNKRNELFEYLCNLDRPETIFESEFFELKKEFDKKIELIMADYEKNVEKIQVMNLEIYFSKEGIINPIINPLAKKYPSKTFMIYKELSGNYNASFRRGDYKVNLPEMIAFALTNIPKSNGGGHVPAAGASFPKQYFPQFKEKMISYLKQNYK